MVKWLIPPQSPSLGNYEGDVVDKVSQVGYIRKMKYWR
jgi:hypothetical protein